MRQRRDSREDDQIERNMGQHEMASEVISFARQLAQIPSRRPSGWLYLPSDRPWNLDSPSAIVLSDEMPPEPENEDSAGISDYAKQQGLMEALPISVTQEIIENARAQKPTADLNDLLKAFLYYYDHDAFIVW